MEYDIKTWLAMFSMANESERDALCELALFINQQDVNKRKGELL